MSDLIPIPSNTLANSVWISLDVAERKAQIGFAPYGRPLNFAERDRAFSVFVSDEGYAETDTRNGVIGEVVRAPDTLPTAVVKIVGDGPPRYHVAEIRGGWTAWVRP